MADKETLKARIAAEIERRRDEIIALAEDILHHPELGYKEQRTAEVVARQFDKLGLAYRTGLALTGVKAKVSTGRPGPCVAVLGELDSLAVPGHPFADPTTGAAHACGHHAQIGTMVGVAMGLLGSGAISECAGDLVFFAVPAEEYVEIEYRNRLRQEGKIEFGGGKPELVRRGEFDDVDLAMMVHATAFPEGVKSFISGSNNGLVAKQIQFIGRSAHAGGTPERGINALNAAMIALSGIHALRETFRNDDTIRVHPIITRGGEVVNAVPADVRMETFVRGRAIDAIAREEKKIDRALRAGAMAVGGKVRIQTLPGYLPMFNDANLAALFKHNVLPIVGEQGFAEGGHRGGSTDMGDLSHIMPTLHPYAGGWTGGSHGADFVAVDHESAYISSTKALAMTVLDLLYDDAAEGRRVVAEFKPRLGRQEYLDLLRSMTRDETFDS